MNKYSLLAVVFTALSSCQTTSTTTPEDRFAMADVNHDGKLSQDESSDYFVGQIFVARDLNHDGKLTWEEWHVPGAQESKAKFNQADTNHDGELSMEEAKARGRKIALFSKQFSEADTNHDGAVTRAEAQAYSASKEGDPR